MTASEIIEAAHRILNAQPGSIVLCTWYAGEDEQRKAAQRAIDGDTDDLELMLDIDAAELWIRSERYQDDFIDNWQPTASESTSFVGMAA